MARSARSGQPNEESVLSGLDSAATTGFYWYLALLACVGGFLFGYDTAVIGSVLEFIPYHLGSFATGYLVAGASLGAAVGALGAGPLTDRYGRKSLLMADAAVFALGAILSAVTINAFMLLSARTLIGVAVAQEHAGIDGHRRQDRSQRVDGRIGHQQGLPPVAVSQRPGPQGSHRRPERRSGHEVPRGEATQVVGDELQDRADDGGVVPEQEPTDAGEQRQIPVKGRRGGGVQSGEHTLLVRLLVPC